MLLLATVLDRALLERIKEGKLPKFFDLIIELISIMRTEHNKIRRSISFTNTGADTLN